jgi:2-polyprenyl-6-methoxyphenol hydroxylase-like FAD-dependent oxidoreductase
VRSVLLERAPGPVLESRSIFLWPRTLEVYRDLGALDALLAAGAFYEAFRPVAAHDERPLLSLDFSDLLAGATAVRGFGAVPQDALERVLRRMVGARPECEVRLAECVGLEQDRAGVDVRLVEGGREATVRGRFVAGCDGARSTVRGALGLKLVGKTYRTDFVLADERVDGHGLAPLRVAVQEPGFLAAVRYAKDLWRTVGTVPESAGDERVLSEAALATRAAALFGRREREAVWASRYRVHRRLAERLRVGRVMLAGDAAHLSSPSGGLGLNAGIQDAENAAWKLAAALRGPEAEAERLLDSYDRERREAIATRVHGNSDRNYRVECGTPAALRPALFRLAAAAVRARPVAEIAARNLSMLDLRYSDSPLLVPGHRLVGARLDDLALGDGRRLSGLLRGRPGLLLSFGAPELGEGIGGVPVYHAGRPPRGWGLRAPSCVVVRPDRHVGAVLDHPTTASLAGASRVALGRGPAPPAEAAGQNTGLRDKSPSPWPQGELAVRALGGSRSPAKPGGGRQRGRRGPTAPTVHGGFAVPPQHDPTRARDREG